MVGVFYLYTAHEQSNRQKPPPLAEYKNKNYGQNEVVEELIRAGKIDEEYMYPFVDTEDEIFEWWLVSPYLARELKAQNEVVIDALECYWWGRTTSGQAIYMDNVIQEIARE